MGGAGVNRRSLANASGTFVRAAATANRMAVAPAEQTYTAFTGELIKTLTDGVPDGAELLDMPPIYRHLRRSMRALGLPEPQGLTAG